MMDINFDSLLSQVKAFWPKEIIVETGAQDPMKFSWIEDFYELHVEPLSTASGSMLLKQLDWIVYCVVNDLSKKLLKIYPHDIRPDILKQKLDELIEKVAIPQLRGEKEWDRSFEKEELIKYLAAEGFTY